MPSANPQASRLVGQAIAYSRTDRVRIVPQAPVWCELCCLLALDLRVIRDPQANADLVIALADLNDGMSVDAAPGRNVVQGARVGGVDVEDRTRRKIFDPILGADDRQRTEQSPRVQAFDVRHASFREAPLGRAA